MGTPSSYVLTSTLMSLGVSMASQDSLQPSRWVLSLACRGQMRTVWCPVWGVRLSHGQVGSSVLPMWCSHAFWESLPVFVQVYALSAWRCQVMTEPSRRDFWRLAADLTALLAARRPPSVIGLHVTRFNTNSYQLN